MNSNKAILIALLTRRSNQHKGANGRQCFVWSLVSLITHLSHCLSYMYVSRSSFYCLLSCKNVRLLSLLRRNGNRKEKGKTLYLSSHKIELARQFTCGFMCGRKSLITRGKSYWRMWLHLFATFSTLKAKLNTWTIQSGDSYVSVK